MLFWIVFKVVLLVIIVVLGFRHRAKQLRQVKKKAVAIPSLSCSQAGKNCYDVLIVGAGPSGSTAAYFLKKKYGKKVALFDRCKFPRVKLCGDAWCNPALNILEEMGVLEKIQKDGKYHSVTRGGFVSPSGFECINREGAKYGSVSGCRTFAIKRVVADEYLVRAAQGVGVDVFEECEIAECNKNKSQDDLSSFWEVKSKDGQSFTGRMLLVCDGSNSYLGKKLGIVPQDSQPEAVCSNQYATANSHQWKDADGVMVFNRATLPGYSALFRHWDDTVYLGTYILPGGKATSRSIAPFEKELVAQHPYVMASLGSSPQWCDRMRVAPIRLGGVPRSYGEQLLLVGDAAGHVDPLTGEGIHTAMIAAKIAAQVVDEMFQNGDLSADSCRAYHYRCSDAFVHEFWYSSMAARVIYRLPIILDAVAVVGQRRGQPFLDFFGEAMTGVRPKSAFLQLGLMSEVCVELVKQAVTRYVLGKRPKFPCNIGVEIVEKNHAAAAKGD